MSDEPLIIARSAAETAAQFADLLAARFGAIAEALRNGEDAAALDTFSHSTHELHDFFTFLSMTADILEPSNGDMATKMRGYLQRIVGIVETLGPALQDRDLVEIADTLEHDVVTSLNAYRELDDGVQDALKAAA